MAIKVGVSGTTVKTVAVAGNNTQVKKVVVGTPVRRVTSGAFNINSLSGVTTAGAVNGSVLVYNGSTTSWTATLDLEEQNINGGSY
tara:strand:- start:1836 stop:2093 length:258 start_codon:yes stop_codon:yes gene_type:complete